MVTLPLCGGTKILVYLSLHISTHHQLPHLHNSTLQWALCNLWVVMEEVYSSCLLVQLLLMPASTSLMLLCLTSYQCSLYLNSRSVHTNTPAIFMELYNSIGLSANCQLWWSTAH